MTPVAKDTIALATLAGLLVLPVAACSAKQDEKPGSIVQTASNLPPSHPPVPTAPMPSPAPAQDELPSGHPSLPADGGMTSFTHPTSGAQSTVDVSADIKAKWKSVKLNVAPRGGAAKTDTVAVGGTLAVAGTKLTLKIVAFVPAFTSAAGRITSSSNEPKNPAVLLRLFEGTQLRAEGWVFQNLPDFDTFRSDLVSVKLVGGVAK